MITLPMIPTNKRTYLFSLTIMSVLLIGGCGSEQGPVDTSSESSSSTQSSSEAAVKTITLDVANLALCELDGLIETDHAGFSGAGYANSDNATSAKIHWHIRTQQAQTVSLGFRYANGAETSRPAELLINDELAANFTFDSTSQWDTWNSEVFSIDLNQGTNLITLNANTDAGLPNIDALNLTGEPLFEGSCAITKINTNKSRYLVGEEIQMNAASFANGDINILSHQWYLSNGQTLSGASVSYSFNQPGDYTVELTTLDRFGQQFTSSKTLTVVEGLANVSVYIAGDSTVSNYTDTSSPNDQAGWGQKLPLHLSESAQVKNHAVGGRSARRFIDEGRLQAIWNEIQPGDYLLVQFGTNDGHRTATYTINGQTIPYYLDPATDFKYYLQQHIDGAKSRNVNLMFVTPPPRNSAYCTGGNGTGAHAQAMRELAAATGTPLLDLNSRVVTYLTAICPSPTPENFFFVRADGSVDGTHFQENGANIMSQMIVEELVNQGLPLGNYSL